MELHACLWNDVDGFSFSEHGYLEIKKHYPGLQVKIHSNVAGFLKAAHSADFILTWDFEESWYKACPKLKTIFTPAAGNDWVHLDPSDKVKLIHGTFHGPLLAESLLGAMLFMNHKMPDMIRNHQLKNWDRNRQTTTRLLGNQNVLLIGLGNIGLSCARLIQHTGADVIGVRRNPSNTLDSDIETRSTADLETLLPWADHVVLLLPGSADTDRFMNPLRLSLMKPGSFIYNFGRGNALASADLLSALPALGGAFLDVTDIEPLPQDSPLWEHANVMITPHSSCVYSEYQPSFISEVIGHLKPWVTQNDSNIDS
jgi:phosphoglycerate dehydrogenase-like enzyme